MKPDSVATFFDCETKTGVRGSVTLLLYPNAYACFLYPHNDTNRLPISFEDLISHNQDDTFESLQNHLKYRIFN